MYVNTVPKAGHYDMARGKPFTNQRRPSSKLPLPVGEGRSGSRCDSPLPPWGKGRGWGQQTRRVATSPRRSAAMQHLIYIHLSAHRVCNAHRITPSPWGRNEVGRAAIPPSPWGRNGVGRSAIPPSPRGGGDGGGVSLQTSLPNRAAPTNRHLHTPKRSSCM